MSMNLFNSLCLSSAVLLTACTGGIDKDSYRIVGEVDGLPDSTVIILTPLAHRSLDPVAEAMVKDGKFEITGKADEPIAVMLSVKYHYGYKTIMLDNVDMSITGTVTSDELDGGKCRYDFSGITLSGSPLTEEYYAMMAPRHRIDSIFLDNQSRGAEMWNLLNRASGEKDRRIMDSIQATEEFRAYGEVEKYCFQAFDSVIHATVEQNRNTIWGPIALLSQLSYLSPEFREVYESFSDSIKNSFHGQLVAQELYPVGRPGDRMPEFTATTIDGKEISLSSLCKDRKCVLLDFWASWCGPCRREIPNLKEIYKRHAGDGFEIVSVSIDTDDAPWKKAVDEEKLSWTNIRDTDKSIADLYKVTSVPTMYIVDSNGCLVAENLRGEELATRIDEILADD